jgi:hypothetical protein
VARGTENVTRKGNIEAGKVMKLFSLMKIEQAMEG